jgi:hypothetical protein
MAPRARLAGDIMEEDKRKLPRTWWCPSGISKTQKHCLQKMRWQGLAEKEREEECDRLFDQASSIPKVT